MVVSDHALLREGLRDLLRRWSEIEIVGVAPAADDALPLSRRVQPDMVLLVRSDNATADAAVVSAVRLHARDCKIISLDAPGRRRLAEDIGADRYMPASVGLAGLVRLMWEVHTNARPAEVGRTRSERSAQSEPRQLLTRREFDVVQAICQGLTNKQIGRRLDISEKTVKNHLSSIYRRCELTGRTELVAWAIRSGLAIPKDDVSADHRSPVRDPRRD